MGNAGGVEEIEIRTKFLTEYLKKEAVLRAVGVQMGREEAILRAVGV
jgi:hypothetical protein